MPYSTYTYIYSSRSPGHPALRSLAHNGRSEPQTGYNTETRYPTENDAIRRHRRTTNKRIRRSRSYNHTDSNARQTDSITRAASSREPHDESAR